jgi:hypothetical protein
MWVHEEKLRTAAQEALRTSNHDRLTNVLLEELNPLIARERRALGLQRVSLFVFGIAIAIFTVIGIKQLLS